MNTPVLIQPTLQDYIKEEGFIPGKFMGHSGKPEIFKLDIPALVRKHPRLADLIGNRLVDLYLRQVHPYRPAKLLGGISEGGELITRAFNNALASRGLRPLQVFNFPKVAGRPTGEMLNGFTPSEWGTRAIIVDDVLNLGGSALRSIRSARQEEMVVTDFLTLVLRHPQGVTNLRNKGVEVHTCFSVGEVISKANAEGWKAFYDDYPLGYLPKP